MVGLLIVSHSAQLAAGVREMALQMAPEAVIAVAGGTDEGGIGTSLELIVQGLNEVDQGDGVLVLMDLGSAVMTTEIALEMLAEETREHVRLSNAPLVEGALAAAPVAATGALLDTVVAAANEARQMEKVISTAPTTTLPAETKKERATIERRLKLINPAGIHARPAAQIVNVLEDYNATIQLQNLDRPGSRSASAHSVINLLSLGAQQGHIILASATGPDAEGALARLSTLVEEGFGELDLPPGAEEVEDQPVITAVSTSGEVRGMRGAAGTAVGAAFHLTARLPDIPLEPAGPPSEERERLKRALEGARLELRHLEQETASRAGTAQAAIFAAQQMMLDDPALREVAHERIDQAAESAAFAWQQTVRTQAETLRALKDPLLAERATDLEDVGSRVIRRLVGDATQIEVPAGVVVLAEEITPSQATSLARSGVAAIATAGGGPTSHAIILARALGIPAVVALGPAILDVEAGTLLLVDGDAGVVHINPPDHVVTSQREAARARRDAMEAVRAAAKAPAETSDGHRVVVAANVSSIEEAQAAATEGAEEVGLLRTEALYADRTNRPSEEEEVTWLRNIFEALEGRRVIVRTLDVGGDKPAPGLDLDPFRNSFLGIRGLRLGLERPELFRQQLRAILRAAAGHRVSLMFPMVSRIEEVRAAQRHLASVRQELDKGGIERGDLEEIGIMVEIPAAALTVDLLATEVDFFSVGSNDLVQYTMAADRTNLAVASLYEPSHLAILRLLAEVVKGATTRGRWVGVCGEMAADPTLAVLLVGLGVRELSMATLAVPAVKAALREVSLAEAQARAQRALELPSHL